MTTNLTDEERAAHDAANQEQFLVSVDQILERIVGYIGTCEYDRAQAMAVKLQSAVRSRRR
jgi:Mg2+/Co2+ transporter CorC